MKSIFAFWVGLIASAFNPCFGITAADFNRARVTDPNSSEIIRQRLYDHLLYPAAGSTALQFFNTAIGQGVATAPGAVVGTTKTVADTNLQVANTLPSGKAYYIETIEVYFYPGTSSTANTFVPALFGTTATAALAAGYVGAPLDVQTFYESGVLTFTVLDKIQLQETPLRSFPPKTSLDLDVSLATADTNTTTAIKLLMAHAKPSGRPYILDPGISLQAAVNFGVTLSWPGVVAMPSTFNGRAGVYFDGALMRAAQ